MTENGPRTMIWKGQSMGTTEQQALGAAGWVGIAAAEIAKLRAERDEARRGIAAIGERFGLHLEYQTEDARWPGAATETADYLADRLR